ncbi:PAS domain S-box-containing protein [Streptomyces calvus]
MSSRPSRGAARLAAILDALPDALVLVNANGTVVNANTIALEAFETPGTALVGRGLLDLLPQFDSKLIPGSMRRPDHIDPRARTKPTRMIARRTDGSEFPVEVTSANLENSQQAYDSYGYTGDELLMLVVRDLSGTVDTEAELARSQRQTEMILRAASEGVVGTDTDGRIVLVNPAAAQILGYRAGELGGRELHTLVLHSRADGSPFPYGESPLADTLRSGRKHRVRGQVLYAKSGDKVPVDLTTAPVRDGDQLVGAVMTFADRRPFDALVQEKEEAEQRHAEELERLAEEHASELTALRQSHVAELEELRERHEEELAANEERYAALGEREKDRYEALAARHEQLLTLLGQSLRGPLEELRRELSALAADDAGQLWPEANQVLHHLSAGYARITTLIDNVLGYQRLDVGTEQVTRTKVMLDAVVAAGVDGAVELIGPGRVQFAVHAPPIEAEVDPRLLATALAHLVADVAGVDATGNTPVAAGGYLDNTVVVAAAQRGEVVRIEVRGPYSGGDPVHEPIVRGIVRAHGGVLQTHEVPGMSGSAFVLEVPIGGGAGAVAPAALPAGVPAAAPAAAPSGASGGAPGEEAASVEAAEAAEAASGGGRRRARRSSVDAFLDSEVPGANDAPDTAPTGRRRRRAAAAEPAQAQLPAQASGEGAGVSGGTGRRRGRPAEGSAPGGAPGSSVELAGAGVSEGAVVTAAEHAAGAAASNTGLGGTVPPQGVPASAGRPVPARSGEQHALPPALPAPSGGNGAAEAPSAEVQVHVPAQGSGQPQATGRRRRALAAANERAAAQEAAPRTVFALPPAEADQGQQVPPAAQSGQNGQAAVPSGQQAGPTTQIPQVPQVPRGAQGAQALGAGQGGPAHGLAHGGQGAQAGEGGVVASGGAPVDTGRHDAVTHDPADDHTPPQPHPTSAPTGRRRRPRPRDRRRASRRRPGLRPPRHHKPHRLRKPRRPRRHPRPWPVRHRQLRRRGFRHRGFRHLGLLHRGFRRLAFRRQGPPCRGTRCLRRGRPWRRRRLRFRRTPGPCHPRVLPFRRRVRLSRRRATRSRRTARRCRPQVALLFRRTAPPCHRRVLRFRPTVLLSRPRALRFRRRVAPWRPRAAPSPRRGTATERSRGPGPSRCPPRPHPARALHRRAPRLRSSGPPPVTPPAPVRPCRRPLPRRSRLLPPAPRCRPAAHRRRRSAPLSRCPPRPRLRWTRTPRRAGRSACGRWGRVCRSRGRPPRSSSRCRRPHRPRTSRAAPDAAASWARGPTRTPATSRAPGTRPPSPRPPPTGHRPRSRTVHPLRLLPRHSPSRSTRPPASPGSRRGPRAPDARTR